MNHNTSTKGFTIVELLIVIVVIAILAAITVVAFNGVQARASDSSTQTTVNQVYKKLQLAKVGGELSSENTEQINTLLSTISLSGLDNSQEFPVIITETYDYTYDEVTWEPTKKPSEYGVMAVSKSGKVYYANEQTAGVAKGITDWDAEITWRQSSLEYWQDYMASPEYQEQAPENIAWIPPYIAGLEADIVHFTDAKANNSYGWLAESEPCWEGHEEIYPGRICINGSKRPQLPITVQCGLGVGYAYDQANSTWKQTSSWGDCA